MTDVLTRTGPRPPLTELVGRIRGVVRRGQSDISWCTVGVYEGSETEIRYRVTGPRGRRRVEETGRSDSGPGSVSAIAPPGDVHRVFNSGTTKAISIHVYGADLGALGSSIRRTY